MREPSEKPAVRVGDAEREHGVELLRDAVVEGRLTLEEFSDRVARAHEARTREDLAALTEDLPRPALAGPSAAAGQRAICSHLVRRGPWDLPARSSFRSYFGTIDLDLRQARLAGPEVELDVLNLFGTVTVIVPDGVRVAVEGGGPFASQFVEAPAEPAVPDAPTVRIRVRGPGGTLHVRTREPQSRLARLLGTPGR